MNRILCSISFLWCVGAGHSQHLAPIDLCAAVQKLPSLANKVVAIRGSIVDKPGVDGSSGISDEIIAECADPRTRSKRTIRVALLEWGEDKPPPKGYKFDPEAINKVDVLLDAEREKKTRSAIRVTVIGQLKVGQNLAAAWVTRSGRKDAFMHRPYVAELEYLSMEDPVRH